MTNASPPRRMPAPWSIQEIAGGYVVDDASRRRLCFIYADRDQRGANNDLLTPDEARRVATAVAKLPGLMRDGSKPKT